MPKYASSRPGSSCQRALERVLDLLAVARGGEPLAAQHPPLHERRVGAGEIEPRFARAAARAASTPSLARDRRRRVSLNRRVELAALRRRAESATRATTTPSAAHASAGAGGQACFSSRVDAVESRGEDRVVDRREPRRFGERGLDRRRDADEQHAGQRGERSVVSRPAVESTVGSHAGPQLLLLGVALERERDQPIEERRDRRGRWPPTSSSTC